MAVKGLTRAQIGRLAGRHLFQQAVFQRVTGSRNGVRTWGNEQLCNARLDPNANVELRADGRAQAYDATVFIRTEVQLDDPADAWRCKVIEPKAPREADDPTGPPEVKRTRYFRVVGIERMQSQDGGDFLSLVRLASDATEPAW